MKIRFLQDTYIRQEPRVGGKPPIGVVYKDAEMEVHDDFIPGDEISRNNIWYCDIKGWFYWSGATRVVERKKSTVDTTPLGKPSWPDNLKVSKQKNSTDALPWTMKPQEPIVSIEESNTSETSKSIQPELQASEGIRTPPLRNPIAQLWETPNDNQLNWGVRNYRIAEDWWQSRRWTGRNVRIALLGTGCDTNHPDTADIEDYFTVSPAVVGLNDYHGLGTQTAIIAAGNGAVSLGVAPEARLLVGKIGDQEHLISAHNMLSGLEWAINKKADVVAILVHFHEMTQSEVYKLQELVSRANSQKTCIIAPVGTMQSTRPHSFYPAQIEGVFAVGAHDQYGQVSSFSARSYHLDILAPGEQLNISTTDGRIKENIKSTAVATAFTAGVIALVRQEHDYSPAKIYELLRETAVRKSFNSGGQNVSYGYGLLNPVELLAHL